MEDFDGALVAERDRKRTMEKDEATDHADVIGTYYNKLKEHHVPAALAGLLTRDYQAYCLGWFGGLDNDDDL